MKQFVIGVVASAVLFAYNICAAGKEAPVKKPARPGVAAPAKTAAKKKAVAEKKDLVAKKKAEPERKKAAVKKPSAEPQAKIVAAKKVQAEKKPEAEKKKALSEKKKKADEAREKAEAPKAAQTKARIDAVRKVLEQQAATDKRQLDRIVQLLKRIQNVARQERAEKTVRVIDGTIKQETEAAKKRADSRAESYKKIQQKAEPKKIPAKTSTPQKPAEKK